MYESKACIVHPNIQGYTHFITTLQLDIDIVKSLFETF